MYRSESFPVIDRVNQKPFLLWQAEAMVRADPGEPQASLPDGVTDVSNEQIVAAKEAVAGAIEEAREQPLTPAPEGGRRGQSAVPLEQRSYLPRNPALSLVQSALDRFLMEHRADDLLVEAGSDPGRRGESTAAVADYRLKIEDDQIPPERSGDRRILGAFQIADPRWISSMVAMGWGRMRGREHFPQRPAEPRELAPDARVVVVGDWASGIERARRVAKKMRGAIDDAVNANRQCHVIHLGDTYYAGWAYEYRRRFLPYWPVDAEEKDLIGSWSLPGNHDMYTGGHGYYSVLLEDERFRPYQQGSSRFSLENEYWQLLGLDSSWKDHELAGDQAKWVDGKLSENEGSRTMLLSHHQPFSAYNDGGDRLRAALREPLAKGRIDAWLWGHEHRCAVYEPTAGLAYGRCVGHGGVPVYAPKPKPPGVRWHLDRSFRIGPEVWAFLGFAILDFQGADVSIAYVNEFGERDYGEQIP
jgi:hypothetical protein